MQIGTDGPRLRRVPTRTTRAGNNGTAVRWGNQNKYLDTHRSWWVALSGYGGWSNFRIPAPKPLESWRVAKSQTGSIYSYIDPVIIPSFAPRC